MSEPRSYTEVYRDYLHALHETGVLIGEVKTRLEIAIKNQDWDEAKQAQEAVIQLRKLI